MTQLTYNNKADLYTTAHTLKSENKIVYTLEYGIDLYLDDVIQLNVKYFDSLEEGIKQVKRHGDVDYLLIEKEA